MMLKGQFSNPKTCATPECRSAWSEVEEISAALARQHERDLFKNSNEDPEI